LNDGALDLTVVNKRNSTLRNMLGIFFSLENDSWIDASTRIRKSQSKSPDSSRSMVEYYKVSKLRLKLLQSSCITSDTKNTGTIETRLNRNKNNRERNEREGLSQPTYTSEPKSTSAMIP